MERDRKVKMTGSFVTEALRVAHQNGGLDQALTLVIQEGMSDGEVADLRIKVQAVCDGKMKLVGSSTTGFEFVEEE